MVEILSDLNLLFCDCDGDDDVYGFLCENICCCWILIGSFLLFYFYI